MYIYILRIQELSDSLCEPWLVGDLTLKRLGTTALVDLRVTGWWRAISGKGALIAAACLRRAKFACRSLALPALMFNFTCKK